ncbi:hypothetical protein [Rhodocyclus purpureus]|uniref:hypothetical protein n=1 Tax=Rhodocyclus purpureus TaxID=1067 RepID=UPI0019115BE3|nr:hypothetical protein [Rhodocyclus purpureus]
MSRVSIPIVAASGCGSRAAQSSCSSGSCSSCAPAAANDDPVSRLQGEGWILRTTIGEPRLSEVAENYRAMGYEVHVELFAEPVADGGCTTCFDAADRSQQSQAWGSVYVRPGRPAAHDELF